MFQAKGWLSFDVSHFVVCSEYRVHSSVNIVNNEECRLVECGAVWVNEHYATSQKAACFVVTAVKTPYPAL
jgi:hypothetical protein